MSRLDRDLSARQRFRFQGNELDLTQFELRQGGTRVPLARLPLEMLIILVQRHGDLVSREQLAELLWADKAHVVDTQAGINNAINRLRRVLNDNPEQPQFIETIIGKGYRFIAPLEEDPAEPATSEHTADVSRQSGTDRMVAFVPRAPAVAASRWRIWTISVGLASIAAASLLIWKWVNAPRLVESFSGSQITFNDGDNPINAAAISPDGASVAYVDSSGTFKRSLATGVTHELEAPSDLQPERISWSPDSKSLLLSGFSSSEKTPQIWKVSTFAKGARKVLSHARNPSFSPDGRQLVFINDDGSQLEIASGEGAESRPFIKAPDRCLFLSATWSQDGRRILYIQQRTEPETPRSVERSVESRFNREYFVRDISDGGVVASESPFPFEVLYPFSGSRLLLVKPFRQPTEEEPLGIWTCGLDRKTDAIARAPQLSISTKDRRLRSVSATADGTTISAVVENGEADVYVAELQSTCLRNTSRLTLDLRSDFPKAWTPDGKAVIFESNRSGRFQLYRQQLNRKTAEMLTNLPGQQVMAAVSPDSKWVLFTQIDPGSSPSLDRLLRVPMEGGTPTEIRLAHTLDEFRCPLRGKACVIRESVGNRSYRFSVLDPIKGQGAVLAEVPWEPSVFGDWTIAADGSAAALPNHKKDAPEILLVSLDASSPNRKIRVKTDGTLWGIRSAANGQGWFGEILVGGKHDLDLIQPDGTVTLLRESDYNIWGVPSPDGSKLAFVDYTLDRNIWLWQRKLQ